MEKIFCYGTLRVSLYPSKGKAFDLRPKGVASLKGRFKMFDLGAFPALVESEAYEPVEIIGEVSEVDNLNNLDRYEGYPRLYTRKQVEVALMDTDEKLTVWVYLFADPEDLGECPEVVSGDWSDRLEGK